MSQNLLTATDVNGGFSYGINPYKPITSFLCDIGNWVQTQIAEYAIWSGSPLFAYN